MKIDIKKAEEEDVPNIFDHYKDWIMNLFPEYSETLS